MSTVMASKIRGPSIGPRLTLAYVCVLLYFLISPTLLPSYGDVGCYCAAAFVIVNPIPSLPLHRLRPGRRRQLREDISRRSLSSTTWCSLKTPCSLTRSSISQRTHSYSSLCLPAKKDDDDFDDSSLFSGIDRPEVSQMPNYIVNYLRNTNSNHPQTQDTDAGDAAQGTTDSPSSSQSFLIAIPLDQCHELGLELESVQRAILYHCPILVHACLPQAILKLPILYVTATTTTTSTSQQQILTQLVQDVVQDVLFKTEEEEMNETSDAGNESGLDAVQREDGSPDVVGRNKEGYQPMLIPFQTLEIDGINNQILHAIGNPNAHGTKRLQTFLQVLQDRIAHDHPTWSTLCPPDPQQSKQQHASSASFRPRVPFVRLPRNWDEYLPKPKDESEEDSFFLTSDEGGNGISPIFWGQWMDDAFGEAARMREIGIYTAQPQGDQSGLTGDNSDDDSDTGVASWSMSDFHDWPESIIPLPNGNDALTQVERRFEQYQQDRLQQAYERERQLAMTKDQGSTPLKEQDEDLRKEDPLFRKTLTRLESLDKPNVSPEAMNQPKASSDPSLGNGPAEATRSVFPMTASAAQPASLGESDDRSSSSEPNDDWMTQRIRQVVASRAKVQTERQLSNPQRTKEKVPLEENPVFAKYKNGTLTPKSQQQSNVPSRAMPPFPSREHCVGFWRVLSSPTGFEVEEGNPSRSDNLVLRIDGTTAGGPILDQVTRQKASAGTWKFNPPNADDDDKGNRLRIRLVIPPQKERVLVLQGKLERITSALPSTMDFTLAPRGTFGIPELEERASRATADMEELLYCSGTVCIEDVITGHNREEIGTFSLLKLNTPTDPSQFTITIPKSVRNQD